MQAASVGEAFLAGELVKKLQFPAQTSILLTSSTSQGFDILQKIVSEDFGANKKISAAYFPFDRPFIMNKALTMIAPRAMILLESELWPGLMSGCKRQSIKLLVVNGRMTQRSLNRYLRWPTIWRELRPDAVLAMSEADSQRFAALFGEDIVGTMANIKFDRIQPQKKEASQENNPLLSFLDTDEAFLVLGSVRQEEEDEVAHLLAHLHEQNDNLIIGLFPRHMHRLPHWQKKLSDLKLPWQLRSHRTTKASPGTIILWDSMGELENAYDLARTAFVGGSLAPVGGQNFLEPLSCGIRPVIGPHWTNFAWIGREIIDQGLVHEAKDWQEVASYLLENVQISPKRRQTQNDLQDFVSSRQGGTQTACQKINDILL
ncbi:MAG: glycosyltransferase N-terminal domain-containing protein [Thermodesulfobacteriota bacterium]